MPPKRKPGTGRKPRGKLLPAQVLPIGQLLTDLTKRGWSLGAKVGMGGCGEIFLAGMQLFVYRGRFEIIGTYSSPTRPVARELTECQGFNEFRLLSMEFIWTVRILDLAQNSPGGWGGATITFWLQACTIGSQIGSHRISKGPQNV